jgi:two-component system phosphate regulon sensor histidine kinase PhoR
MMQMVEFYVWQIVLGILFFGGSGMVISTWFWQRRKQRVLKNLQKLITTEGESYGSSNSEIAQNGKTIDFNLKSNEILNNSIVSTNPNSHPPQTIKSLQAKDIEEMFKTLFEARKQELQRLQILENYRRDYIGNVAHELKTPLFSIQGYIETILDDPEMDLELLKSFLKKANNNAERLGQIVSDLDAITKYESGFLNIEKSDFNIFELVNQVIDELEIPAKQKAITLFATCKTENPMVHGDQSRIRQVLVNLGYNSIKYGKEKGSTDYTIYATGEKIIIEVADNGIGIPQNSLGRIFERFYRVDSHRSRETGGSGLGLSICKHIIEAHGSTIQVMSTEGAGSVFQFALPQIQIPEIN